MHIKKEKRQSSLIHQKIRKASFVPVEQQNTKKFKYIFLLKGSKNFKENFIVIKTFYNKIVQTTARWLRGVDFKAIGRDVSSWTIEALIEGFVINFVVWALIGLKFSLITMLAWGFAIKYSLNIYERIKKDGSNTTIPKKNE